MVGRGGEGGEEEPGPPRAIVSVFPRRRRTSARPTRTYPVRRTETLRVRARGDGIFPRVVSATTPYLFSLNTPAIISGPFCSLVVRTMITRLCSIRPYSSSGADSGRNVRGEKWEYLKKCKLIVVYLSILFVSLVENFGTTVEFVGRVIRFNIFPDISGMV